jgi:hypothetical protein
VQQEETLNNVLRSKRANPFTMTGYRVKRSIFSPALFLQVRSFVDQGLSAAEIAEKLGCTLGTLRVKCSQSGISLRRWNAAAGTPRSNISKLTILLPENVTLALQKQADKKGVSQADLAVTLLVAIARDNLYDAVIDHDIEPKKHKESRPRVDQKKA